MDLIVDFPDQAYTSLISRFVEQTISRCEEEMSGINEIKELMDGGDLSKTFVCSDKITPLLVDFPSASSSDADIFLVDASDFAASVAFEPCARVKYVENWTEDRKEVLWLTKSEIQTFADERKRDIKVIKIIQRSIIGDNNYHHKTNFLRESLERVNITRVGIEHYIDIDISVNKFSLRRKEHCKNVLEEQARQKQCKEDDPELIANVSRKGSEQSMKRALALGMQHAK
eukprot:CAMPEP_0183703426 /NCGR_PEP_ID=MMETSP0737-20130205/1168_1 /TAXON_ID=385413 /ORGANISM="Thalassiosira miniscula, Strain CCMP1093" /LENGTH=228 /DNA_ID=CAMNT_0025930175 /DNA_START=270 /DNA_END=956 /DNA_ORIENTATION=+